MATTETLVHRIRYYAETDPTVPAIHGKKDGAWETYTWAEYWSAVREVAKGLIALGHEPGDCVALVGNNRPEWVICQFGIMAARGAPAPIYVTNTEEQTAHIVQNSRADIAICDTKEQLEKYRTCASEGLMEVDVYVTFDDVDSGDDQMTIAALRALGRDQSDEELDRRIASMEDDELAFLIYTSGTTGVSKGVMLTHRNMMSMADAIVANMGEAFEANEYRLVSYLPLCHVAEQLMTTFAPLMVRGEVYFCDDLKQIKDYLVDVRPTVFMGVPRVWEKFQAVLEGRFAEATGVKAALLRWARKTELAAFREEVESGAQKNSLARTVAENLVLSKLRAALGMDQLIGGFTGAAPISQGTLEFFASLGITVYEAYGMSETSGVATSQEYRRPRFGTVGRAIKGVEIEIASDGEILLKGPNMTSGYLHMPEKTDELIDDDGWLHTGDLGVLDSDGYLSITGRKKDILITAGGKNVAPAEMEALMKQIPGVGQAIVVGDRKPYLSALVTLDPEGLPDLAARLNIDSAELSVVSQAPAVRQWLEPLIESECNENVARYQTIKRFAVLPVEFTVEGGELTPTMKLKRNVITEKYAGEIEALFAQD